MFGRVGLPELLLILTIALLVFGPSKIPDIGKSLGKGIREFKKATQEIQKAVETDEDKKSEA